MCQILGIAGEMTPKEIHEHFFEPNLYTNAIRQYMYVKGGQGQPISALLSINDFTIRYDNYEDVVFGDKFDAVARTLAGEKCNFSLILFARMEPETERETDTRYLYQPYYNPFTKSWYFVHGLISNAEEIAKDSNYSGLMQIDTDIFAYDPNVDQLIDGDKLEGNFIVFRKHSEIYGFEIINNSGLGVWKLDPSWFFFGTSNPFDSNLVMFGTSRRSYYDSYILTPKMEITTHKNYMIDFQEKDKRIGFALYSGGLDITATSFNYKSEFPNARLIGMYFDYGARASQKEIEAGKEAVQYGLLDDFKVIDIKPLYEILDLNSKLTDRYSDGDGVKEAESTQAYVPYRNTLMFTILASLMENQIEEYGIDENTQVDFLIGANLSEGMVYNDNTSAFLENMQNVINLGGKKNYFINIYSPFVNKTKTEMLTHFTKEEIETIFELSYSCYYPNEDGSACGKCGSCLLRQKALERVSKQEE